MVVVPAAALRFVGHHATVSVVAASLENVTRVLAASGHAGQRAQTLLVAVAADSNALFGRVSLEADGALAVGDVVDDRASGQSRAYAALAQIGADAADAGGVVGTPGVFGAFG